MKAHLGIDARTLEIRAFEVTDNAIGDAPILLALLAQIPADEPIARVSADGAYDTRACDTTIAQRGAMAVIATRKNGKPWKGAHRACRRATRRFKPPPDWAAKYGKSGVLTSQKSS